MFCLVSDRVCGCVGVKWNRLMSRYFFFCFFFLFCEEEKKGGDDKG